MKILLALILLASTAQAAPFTVVFKNKCPDLIGEDYSCLNRSQAAQHGETISQIELALKNARYKKPITIYSIDPKFKGKWKEGVDIVFQDDLEYTFGAWLRNGKVYFAAMPGSCPNARKELERLLRKLK